MTPFVCFLFLTATCWADLEENVREFWVPEIPPESTLGQDSLAKLETDASEVLKRQKETGFFEGADPDSVSRWGRGVQAHVELLLVLARAHETPGQGYFESEEALNGFSMGLAALESVLEVGMDRPGNWWNWEIGLPRAYGPTLVLMQDHIESSLLEEAISTLGYLIENRPKGITMVGQNLIWVSFTRIYLGILNGEKALIDWAEEKISSVVRITLGEGVQPDYSFKQHGSSLQTGHYGAAFAQDVGIYANLTEGTPWALPEEALDIWLAYLREGARWAIYQNYYEPSSRGRGIVRREKPGSASALHALLLGAALEGSERNELQRAARQILETWQMPLDPSYAKLAESILKEGGNPAGPVGFRFYPYSDYAIHRGEDWFISLKLLSDRTLAAERVNDEGKQSRHLSSGVTWMMLTGDEWDREGVRPALDWELLPGATVERGLDLSKSYPNYKCFGLRSFVGGLESGARHGVAAMDFKALHAQEDSNLMAKKSWFFWPGGFVALGSSITGRSGLPVDTIAMQWPLYQDDSTIMAGGLPIEGSSWTEELQNGGRVTTDDWSLWFPAGQSVRVERRMQQGSFIEITRSGETVYEHPFLNILVPHGVDPVDAQYAYALLPGENETESDDLPFKIRRQKNGVHAVEFPQQGLLSTVFWKPGREGPLAAKQPMLASLESLGGKTYALSVADPTQSFDGPLEIEIAGAVSWHKPEGKVDVMVMTTADGLSVSHLQIDTEWGETRRLTLEIENLSSFGDQPVSKKGTR